jgi:hypothetical protein
MNSKERAQHMVNPVIVDEFEDGEEEVFVIAVPEDAEEDDENTEIVFPILTPEEAAALL